MLREDLGGSVLIDELDWEKTGVLLFVSANGKTLLSWVFAEGDKIAITTKTQSAFCIQTARRFLIVQVWKRLVRIVNYS